MNRVAISGLFVVGLTATLVTAQQKIANPKAETNVRWSSSHSVAVVSLAAEKEPPTLLLMERARL